MPVPDRAMRLLAIAIAVCLAAVLIARLAVYCLLEVTRRRRGPIR